VLELCNEAEWLKTGETIDGLLKMSTRCKIVKRANGGRLKMMKERASERAAHRIVE
jgi:hypothetical protein